VDGSQLAIDAAGQNFASHLYEKMDIKVFQLRINQL
jgi:hypothetical protein